MRVVHATYIVAAWYENPSVVGRLPLEKQTKESVRRDKRLSSVYCMAQKHLLVGASLSTVCLYCLKHLLAYFRKHLLAYFRKHLLAYFLKQLLRHLLQKQLLPLTIEPSASHVIHFCT